MYHSSTPVAMLEYEGDSLIRPSDIMSVVYKLKVRNLHECSSGTSNEVCVRFYIAWNVCGNVTLNELHLKYN